TLAAMIPAPNLFDPFERPGLVRARRNQVLHDMVTAHRLDAGRADTLAREPLDVRRGVVPADRFPSYVGYLRDQLGKDLPEVVSARNGLAVFTHMDLVWQSRAEAELAAAVTALDGGGVGRPPLEGAFAALEPGTGAVRALVGS